MSRNTIIYIYIQIMNILPNYAQNIMSAINISTEQFEVMFDR
jgi:hypothetical protein